MAQGSRTGTVRRCAQATWDETLWPGHLFPVPSGAAQLVPSRPTGPVALHAGLPRSLVAPRSLPAPAWINPAHGQRATTGENPGRDENVINDGLPLGNDRDKPAFIMAWRRYGAFRPASRNLHFRSQQARAYPATAHGSSGPWVSRPGRHHHPIPTAGAHRLMPHRHRTIEVGRVGTKELRGRCMEQRPAPRHSRHGRHPGDHRGRYQWPWHLCANPWLALPHDEYSAPSSTVPRTIAPHVSGCPAG